MSDHRLRLLAITALLVLGLCGVIFLQALERPVPDVLLGALAVLVPALLDASAVARRKRLRTELELGTLRAEHNASSAEPPALPNRRDADDTFSHRK